MYVCDVRLGGKVSYLGMGGGEIPAVCTTVIVR